MFYLKSFSKLARKLRQYFSRLCGKFTYLLATFSTKCVQGTHRDGFVFPLDVDITTDVGACLPFFVVVALSPSPPLPVPSSPSLIQRTLKGRKAANFLRHLAFAKALYGAVALAGLNPGQRSVMKVKGRPQ